MPVVQLDIRDTAGREVLRPTGIQADMIMNDASQLTIEYPPDGEAAARLDLGVKLTLSVRKDAFAEKVPVDFILIWGASSAPPGVISNGYGDAGCTSFE